MAGNTEEVVLRLTGDSSSASRSLEQIGAKLDAFKSKVDQAAQAGKYIAVVFGGLSAIGGKLIQSTAKVAMRNEVLAISLYTVARNAGYSRQEMDILTDRVKALGITTQNARLSLVRFIQGNLDLAKATDLARTAQDLAVIAGENSSEATMGLANAIVSLQPRLLRKYGIVTTLNQALGDLAHSDDVAAKRNRMLEFVLAEGAKVAGVYQEAMGVVGKRITSIPRLVEEAKAALGEHFLPIIGKGVDLLSKLLEWFEKLPPGIQRALAMFVLFGTAGSAVLAALGGLLAMLPFIISGFTALSGFIAPILPALGQIAIAIGVLIAAGAALARAWEGNWGGIRDAVTEAWDKIKGILTPLIALVQKWGEQFKLQIGAISNSIRTLLEPAFARLAQFIGSIDWGSMLGTLMDALNVIGKTISAFLVTLNRLLRGEGLRAFRGLEDAAIDGLTLVALVFDKYVKKAAVWGWNLIVNVANGISKAAQSVIVKVMNFVGSIIGRFLAPGSPPKEGPLSNIVKWGQGVINTFLQAFGLADFGLMREAMAPIQSALESALQAGDIDEAGFAETFGKAREQVAELIATFRQTGEISEETLGKIAETLGAGSEEYVKFLRLQLQHQKALEKLEGVQAEVAEAEAKGFIPKALKDKLKAAKAEAGAAKDAVDWQREYLAMQQESIDMQLRLVQVLEDLNMALADVTEPEMGAGGAEAGEVAVPSLDLGELGVDTSGLDEISATLGQMTPEFEAMREKVEGWWQAFKNWLDLPFSEKLQVVFDWLTQIINIDFAGYWSKITALAQPAIDALSGLASWLKQKIPEAVQIVAGIWYEVLLPALETVQVFIRDFVIPILQKIADTFTLAIGVATTVLTALWRSVLLPIFRLVWGFVKNSLIPFFQALADVILAGVGLASRILAGIWNNILKPAFETIYNLLSVFIIPIFNTLKDLLQKFIDKSQEVITEIRENLGPALNWFQRHVLNPLKNALHIAAEKIAGIVGWLRELKRRLDEVNLPGWLEGHSPSPFETSLHGIAGALSEVNSELSSMETRMLRLELGRTNTGLAGAGGGVRVEQNITGDWLFPDVHDGRDAQGVQRGLSRLALEAAMAGRTQG